MKCHSSDQQQPETVKVKCRKCGGEFEEFITVWLTSFLVGDAPLICIECDPQSDVEACQWVDTVHIAQ